MQNNQGDDLTAPDGRKIISFSSGGESYAIEGSAAKARAKMAELEATLAERRAAFNPLAIWQGVDRNQRELF